MAERSSTPTTDRTAAKDDTAKRSTVDETVNDEPSKEPEYPEHPTVAVVDTRVHITPQDRATYVGPANARNTDIEIPDEFVSLPEEAEELDGEHVDVFQVISTNGAVALRVDGKTYIFDSEQSSALARDLTAARMNVTY